MIIAVSVIAAVFVIAAIATAAIKYAKKDNLIPIGGKHEIEMEVVENELGEEDEESMGKEKDFSIEDRDD